MDGFDFPADARFGPRRHRRSTWLHEASILPRSHDTDRTDPVSAPACVDADWAHVQPPSPMWNRDDVSGPTSSADPT